MQTYSQLELKIKNEKAYTITFPKDHYKYYWNQSEFNITSDSVTEKQCDITITLINTSRKILKYGIMSCSWWDNFLVNNNYMFIEPDDCLKNIPIQVELKPGESKTYPATLTKSIKFDYPCRNCVWGPQVADTKLGFILIESDDYESAMEDKSQWKIIWSNALHY